MRPNVTPKFQERLARDTENVNAINKYGDTATRIAEKIAEASVKDDPTRQALLDLGVLRDGQARFSVHVPEFGDAERDELNQLRSEMASASLGDRPHNIGVEKLRRLIELESAESASLRVPDERHEFKLSSECSRLATCGICGQPRDAACHAAEPPPIELMTGASFDGAWQPIDDISTTQSDAPPPELLHCPWCGNTPEPPYTNNVGETYARLRHKEGCCLGLGETFRQEQWIPSTAFEAWNTRADIAAVREWRDKEKS